MNSMAIYDFREKYPTFIYRSYSVTKDDIGILLAFNFTIEGLCDFSPQIRIDTEALNLKNGFDSDTARKIVFSLGLVEAVSYFKAVCPKTVRVLCGGLNESEKLWFRKLWYRGLGEFFYINGIEMGFDEFITIDAPYSDTKPDDDFVSQGVNLIPVGGGKDSCVTASLLKDQKNLFFTVNDQKARTDCVRAAGYTNDDIIRTYRTIDKNLLELNSKGFLNGHTPFSAIVAFLSLYCAYITGCDSIILSNESSANEGNTSDEVNHQYSKSYTFESDFNEYVYKNITSGIKYFSLLRPFNELQIAKFFAGEKQYHKYFRSCNKGSKKNVWCCSCPKCLFVYGILSPFLSDEEMSDIFPENLFENESLLEDFKGLTGQLPVKPFECVGTAEEYLYAVSVKARQLIQDGKPLPYLLRCLSETEDIEKILRSGAGLLSDFNYEHLVPQKFLFAVKEMERVVSACN